VIGGTPDGVDAASEQARQLGVRKVVPLNVGGAFHTPLMAHARAVFEPVLAATAFSSPSAPVVSNVDGEPHTDPADWPTQLADHLVSPVRWRSSMLTLDRLGVDSLVELGPGKVLAGLARRTVPNVAVRNVSTPQDVATLFTRVEVH
jgi:[acyl-carrier-protein] S-malonyltransferase